MRIQIISDVHIEFFAEYQRLPFLNDLRLAAADVDVVVLAGDIASHELLRPTLEWFCEAYAEVVYVPGNHEFYGSSFEVVRGILKVASKWYDKLHDDGGLLVLVHPLDELVEERRPAVWVHGHTHLGGDYEIGETRVVCNPFGYETYQVNKEFWRCRC